jgi:lactam utilization protein B
MNLVFIGNKDSTMSMAGQKSYLSYNDAASFIGYKVGTLRNFVSKGILKLNIHYLKPHGGKVLFVREALETWIKGN